MGIRVYVASSWKNTHYDRVCEAIRARGHEVADWREGEHPMSRWSAANEEFERASREQSWTPELARAAVTHPLARAVFERDMRLLDSADALVLLTPCGRSAHFEAGIAQGREMPRAILFADNAEPELMTADLRSFVSPDELCAWLDEVESAFTDAARAGDHD